MQHSKHFYVISYLVMRNLGSSAPTVHGLQLNPQLSTLSLLIIFPIFPFLDEILSIMATSRRLRQESKTSDTTAPLPSYRGRERSSSKCMCGRNCAFPIGCSGLQCNGNGSGNGNGNGNGVGPRDANDFHQNNSMSSTGPTGLEVKVINVTISCHLC